MAAGRNLQDDLQKKLGLSRRSINRRIALRENERVLPRWLAMLSLARDAGMTLRRYASDEEISELRHQDRSGGGNGASDSSAPSPSPQPSARAPRVVTRSPTARKARKPSGPRDKVFVVHGRDTAVKRSMFSFLRAVGLDPLEWNKALDATKKAQPSIPETLDAAFEVASAVVVLLTPDDLVELKRRLWTAHEPAIEKTPTGQARPNVLFEAGMAFGRHPDATVLVMVGDVKPFSDVGGLHITRLDDSAERRTEFVDKLRRAGCAVDTASRTDWYREGTFKIEED